MTNFEVVIAKTAVTPPKPKRTEKTYSLLLDLLDHGWQVRHFNSNSVTLERE